MAAPRKLLTDRMAGEILFTEVFKIIERLNAAAGASLVALGKRTGNMTFSPKIIIDEDGHKQYDCFVEIYTQQDTATGEQMNMEWSGRDVEGFKKAATTAFLALSTLAKEGYISDMFTVGLIKPDGEESEVYAPQKLEPGVYSLKEI